MTRLTKAVTRLVSIEGADIAVTLRPTAHSGEITFRVKGRRTAYTTTLAAAYWLAVKQYAMTAAKEKAAAKRAAKLARQQGGRA